MSEVLEIRNAEIEIPSKVPKEREIPETPSIIPQRREEPVPQRTPEPVGPIRVPVPAGR